MSIGVQSNDCIKQFGVKSLYHKVLREEDQPLKQIFLKTY